MAENIDEEVTPRSCTSLISVNRNNLQEINEMNSMTRPEYLKQFISQKIQENIDGFIINY